MDIKAAHNLQEKQRTKDIEIEEIVTFDEMHLSGAVLQGLQTCGYIRPSPIQLMAIPLGRCGLDLIVQAKSGTGKTCVFSVVALEMISVKAKTTQVLAIAPTREIAVQIGQVINSIGSSLPELKAYTFIGGINLTEDKTKLSCCHIAIGTPGRLNHLVSLGYLNLSNVRLLVLDEADQLLTGEFKISVLELVDKCPFNKQILALSATYPVEVTEFLDKYMRSPSHVRLGKDSPALIGVKQFVRLVPNLPQPHIRHKLKLKVLFSVLSSVSFNQCIVFSNSQLRAESICDQLKSSGWPATFLTGGQVQAERSQAYDALCTYKCRILVSTDLSARGLDSQHVNLVINLDIPMDQVTYLHRVGRAGRYGSFGVAISLACEGMEWEALRAVVNVANVTMRILPENFDTDLIQNKYDSFEVVPHLNKEQYLKFLEKASTRKKTSGFANTEVSVDSNMDNYKELENKTSKLSKTNLKSKVKQFDSKHIEEEKDSMYIQVIKTAMHSYTKEANLISFSHDNLVDKISEDLKNILEFDRPHSSTDSILKEYPKSSIFTTLESYIGNSEKISNAVDTANIPSRGGTIDRTECLESILKGQSSEPVKDERNFSNICNNVISRHNIKLQNGMLESSIKENYENSDAQSELIIEDFNGKSNSFSLKKGISSIVMESSDETNSKISVGNETVKNICMIGNSLSDLKETEIRSIPKKLSPSSKQKAYCENTGYGAWEPVTTTYSTNSSFEKTRLQVSSSNVNEFLEKKIYFSDNYVSDEYKEIYSGNTFCCPSYIHEIDEPPLCFNSNSNYVYNYKNYCISTNAYIRTAQKFASMMEYVHSVGRMSAWIAQDNNDKLLNQLQGKRRRKSLVKN